VDNKVFVYLRLRIGETTLSQSKIREFGALGSLLPQFLKQTVERGIQIPQAIEESRPVLDYVDANTDDVLISFRLDPVARVQVIEGRIPPAHQGRMLDPNASSFSFRRFMASAVPEGQPLPQMPRVDLLQRIRETIDEDGYFLVQLPI
jgi:hypothetical protein